MVPRNFSHYIIALMLLLVCGGAQAGLMDSVEKALMPGELSKPHAKYEQECKQCHEMFKKGRQNHLCLKCHDHKNIRLDIDEKKGLHGRMPAVRDKDCSACHSEHRGRDNSIVVLDQQTFNHAYTDFTLEGSHASVACTGCHKKDKPYREAKAQCVDCHKNVEPHKGKLGKKCNSCHRSSDWEDFIYDHSRTDFPLKGKHKGVQCKDCHPQEKYLGVPKECYGCHKGDDKHDGANGKKCKDCHSENGWASTNFDHDKDTKFPLRNGHKLVHCDQCHKQPAGAGEKKKKPERTCYSCHRYNDAHKGLYGEKCQDCHTDKEWKKHKFDHGKTDFELKGKHEKVQCRSCHPGNLYKDKVPVKCYGCHKQDDPHDGKQGKLCNDCHNESGWQNKVVFDHNLTKFPLLGGHAALTCEECHTSSNFRDATIKCADCHKDDDHHKRRLGVVCQRCHYSTDWKVWEFDHDKQTDYPLKGAHKGIRCELCHREEVETDLKVSSVCYRCHSQDDVHEGEFGRLCGRCHDVEDFKHIRVR